MREKVAIGNMTSAAAFVLLLKNEYTASMQALSLRGNIIYKYTCIFLVHN